MTKYIFHKAGNNERWDSIAYKYYGNCYNIQPIIEANPHVPISAIITEGTELKIPIEETTSTNTSLLPVWKQQ
ncbi:MAG: tail protein X [Candidatus Gastranaerophilales bacterium]|nr:tail protein X [Candidatus Gastranaerophilales bacterium]